MCECMTFPNDWREFLKDYSFKDTDEVYTNGAELISVFRVEQLIEHLLLKQESVKPYLDFDGLDVWRCGACGTSLFHHVDDESEEDMKNYVRYCKHCGRPVRWNDKSESYNPSGANVSPCI